MPLRAITKTSGMMKEKYLRTQGTESNNNDTT